MYYLIIYLENRFIKSYKHKGLIVTHSTMSTTYLELKVSIQNTCIHLAIHVLAVASITRNRSSRKNTGAPPISTSLRSSAPTIPSNEPLCEYPHVFVRDKWNLAVICRKTYSYSNTLKKFLIIITIQWTTHVKLNISRTYVSSTKLKRFIESKCGW